MPSTQRSRRLGARPDDVWRVVGDPQHLPRWWPRVQRVEADDGRAFTQVLVSDKGRSVRADFRRADIKRGRRIAWVQELPGTPFERLLSYARTDIELEPAEGGTEVTVRLEQKLRGFARFGVLFFRGAARRQLDEALDGLEHAIG